MTQSPSTVFDAVPSDIVAKAPLVSQHGPHELECFVQRSLQAHPGLKFARLVVHQCPQGLCLEGLLETNEQELDLCQLVNEIAGVKVINRVVTQPTKSA